MQKVFRPNMSFLLFLGNSRQVSSNHMKNLVNYSLRFFPHHVRLKFQMSLSVHSSNNPRRNSSQSPTFRMSMTRSGDPFQAKEDINVRLAGFFGLGWAHLEKVVGIDLPRSP